jgi:orotate phosphoribosyltransferase
MDKPLTDNPRLAQVILELAHKEGAVLFGDFTLSSGRKSDHYWDGKKVTLHPTGAYLVGKAIFDLIRGLNVDAIGGLEVGAIPVATAVALVSAQEGKPIPAFIVRKNRKEHGTRNEIEGFVPPDGSRVVIVDDVITSGDSIQKAIEAVEQRGCKVVKVITLVDRHEGGCDRLRSQGYAFESLLDFRQVKGKTILGESKTTGSGLKEELLC